MQMAVAPSCLLLLAQLGLLLGLFHLFPDERKYQRFVCRLVGH